MHQPTSLSETSEPAKPSADCSASGRWEPPSQQGADPPAPAVLADRVEQEAAGHTAYFGATPRTSSHPGIDVSLSVPVDQEERVPVIPSREGPSTAVTKELSPAASGREMLRAGPPDKGLVRLRQPLRPRRWVGAGPPKERSRAVEAAAGLRIRRRTPHDRCTSPGRPAGHPTGIRHPARDGPRPSRSPSPAPRPPSRVEDPPRRPAAPRARRLADLPSYRQPIPS